MLDGFGLAPVCLELDLDSYEGDWRHVSRFRGRSGWLTVAEAHLQAGRHEWTTTLVAACDEWGEPVPNFMVPNLLACACSFPEPCSEYPPIELDKILQGERGELKRRWLRENNQALQALDAQTTQEVEHLEAEAKQRIASRDAAIADLRRRRRNPGASHEQRALFTDLIHELEDEQDVIAERLIRDRSEVRGKLIVRERQLLNRTDIRVAVEPLYYVSWRSAPRPNSTDRLRVGHDSASHLAALRARLPFVIQGLKAAEADVAELKRAGRKNSERWYTATANRSRLADKRHRLAQQISKLEPKVRN